MSEQPHEGRELVDGRANGRTAWRAGGRAGGRAGARLIGRAGGGQMSWTLAPSARVRTYEIIFFGLGKILPSPLFLKFSQHPLGAKLLCAVVMLLCGRARAGGIYKYCKHVVVYTIQKNIFDLSPTRVRRDR